MRTSTIIVSTLLSLLLAGCASPAPTAATPEASATPVPATASSIPLPPLTPQPAAAADPLTLDPVGQFGGSATALVIRGTTAFVAMGPRLETFDISDPAKPVLVGRSTVIPEMAWIQLEGGLGPIAAIDHYIVLSTFYGIAVLDAPSDGDPVVVSYVKTPNNNPTGIVISGHLGFVATQDDAMLILDLSDPTSPGLASTVKLPASPTSIAASGDTAFVSDSETVRVIDASDPANPKIVSTLPTTSNSLAVSGSTLYVDGGTYDITNLAAPKPLTLGPAVRNAYAMLGHIVFTDSGGIFDVSSPDAAMPVSTPLDLDDSVAVSGPNLAIRGHILFLARDSFQIFDLSRPPEQVGSDCNCVDPNPYQWSRIGYVPGGVALTNTSERISSRLSIVGEYLYTFSTDTVYVWSLETPGEPTLVRTLAFPSSHGNGIQTDTGFVFTPPLTRDYTVIDTRDAANPVVSTLPAPWLVTDGFRGAVASKGNMLFLHVQGNVTNREPAALAVYDMSDPLRPIKVGSYAPYEHYFEAYVAGEKLVTPNVGEIVSVLDISDLAAPRLVAAPYLETLSGDQIVANENTIVAINQKQLRSFSTEDLVTPMATLEYEYHTYLSAAFYAGGLLWLETSSESDNRSQLTLINTHDPANPHIVARIRSLHDAVAADGAYAYVAVNFEGIYVYKLPTN